MSGRTTAGEEELCGVKEEPPHHQHWTLCKTMDAEVVLHNLEDVSQAHLPEHQESACIKEEEEESPCFMEGKDFIHLQGSQT
ncbi:uncharacterized protein LOC130927903 isoform X2 [Corythoichthys intestinalis]|uniref:uncharacterized protein LOC130927903 isoform X2 n=1 Tax=Corythoichthys intestinalis TaxID=161448 RepID=UPI0025A4F22E|nr:uncharacterized protein LOC130927903 isoform X2 [Corythoichthys intestinalis]